MTSVKAPLPITDVANIRSLLGQASLTWDVAIIPIFCLDCIGATGAQVNTPTLGTSIHKLFYQHLAQISL
ncbi:hypothetical protein ID866_4585 [Astraeus odoratus]|nr:hypothetical protein ID866_4585 [Astraeus odoratus]